MKTALVLGAGGFIGSHLVKRLKEEGFWVRGVDLKRPEHWDTVADDFVIGDLRDPRIVRNVMLLESNNGIVPLEHSFSSPRPYVEHMLFDEVYQLAADMGGAGYIFSGENDFNVMHNSSLINLNVVEQAIKFNVKRIFYSSSACMYPEHNQLDPHNPNCEESSAYPANPDSEYGWEKLFSERIYLAANRNYKLDVRIARFHNIFGPQGTWKGGKEKSPAAMCRKVAESKDGDTIEVWGDGQQTRSFLFINECIEAMIRLMRQDNFTGPVNIGSEEKVSINELANMVINISEKKLKIKNIYGEEFEKKYGYKCPLGVKGRNSDNKLYKEKIGWTVSQPLEVGLRNTYQWINKLVNNEQ